jgi:hypothetical protein
VSPPTRNSQRTTLDALPNGSINSWNAETEVVLYAVGIVQPVAVAHREDPAPEDVVLVPVALDAHPTTFSIFIERPGTSTTAGPARTPTAKPTSGGFRWPPVLEPAARLT